MTTFKEPVYLGTNTGVTTTRTDNPVIQHKVIEVSAGVRTKTFQITSGAVMFDANYNVTEAWSTMGQGYRLRIGSDTSALAYGSVVGATMIAGGNGRFTPQPFSKTQFSGTIVVDVTASVAASAADIVSGLAVISIAYSVGPHF